MKKFLRNAFITVILFAASSTLYSQDTLVGWTFPTGQPADTIADIHNLSNTGKHISPSGGVSGSISFTNGATTYAETATGWENGMGVKCWITGISTLGYQNLALNSKQRSGGNNPGPKDFAVQYKVGENGEWTEVPGSTILVANDWSGELINIPLPEECSNQQEMVFLRWVMTSNINSQGETVGPNGISKIDDIFITGDVITAIVQDSYPGNLQVFPNPCNGYLTIACPYALKYIDVYDISGKIITRFENILETHSFDISGLPGGVFFLEITLNDNKVVSKKIVKSAAY